MSGKLSEPVCQLLLSTLQLIQTAGYRRYLIHDLSLSGCRLVQSRLQLADAGHQLVEALRQCRLSRCRFGITCIGFVKPCCGTFQLTGNLAQSASQLRCPHSTLCYGALNRLVVHILQKIRMCGLKAGKRCIQTGQR
ncbi:hypothetical protein D3C75_972510 [compost metagenome]